MLVCFAICALYIYCILLVCKGIVKIYSEINPFFDFRMLVDVKIELVFAQIFHQSGDQQ